MIYKTYIILFMFFSSFYILAQEYTLKGTVIDQNLHPLAFVEVVIFDNEQRPVEGILTDESGIFSLTKLKDHYILKIIRTGEILYEKELNLDDNIDLGRIEVIAVSELDEVIVTSNQRVVERKVDRLVFNVGNSIAATGGDGLEVLQKSPRVRMDGNAISLLGKSSVNVLINDRLIQLKGKDLVDYLQSLHADDIAKIEVITTPPAKYDAQGNSGLINIVLKKAKRNHFSTTLRTAYRQATYATGSIGGGITYQKNKISFFTNINGAYGSNQPVEKFTFVYPTQVWNAESKLRYFVKGISGRVGVDYELSNKSSLGVQYLTNVGNPDIDETTSTRINNKITKQLDSLLFTTGEADNFKQSHAINTHFKTDIDSIGKTVSVDLDYFTYISDVSRTNTTNTFDSGNNLKGASLDIFKNTSYQDIQTISGSVDFEWPTKTYEVSFGSKVSFIKNDSDITAQNFIDNQFVIDQNQTNRFMYKEKVQAFYASLSNSIDSWDYKLGLRTEVTQTEGVSENSNQINKNDYISLFPTAYVSWNPNDDHTLALSYSRRINRPGYNSLNPFRWFSNPFAFTEGNPFLQPSFTNNLEVSHLFKNKLSSALYFSINENAYGQITFADTDSNIQATVWRNFLNEYTYGLTQSYVYDSLKWLEVYVEADLNYTKITSDVPNTLQDQQGFNFYTSVNNSFTFNNKKTFLGGLNFWYAAPGVNGINFYSEAYNFDVGCKLFLFNKKLQASLLVTDIFKTNRSISKTTVNMISQRFDNYYDRRQLRFSLLYRFGNSKIRSKAKEFSNEAERKRVD